MVTNYYSDLSSASTSKLDKDIDAIKNSIKNILLTPIGSMPGKPLFGSNITDYLFENISPGTSIMLSNEVTVAIGNWEKRAEVVSVDVIEIPEYNKIHLEIKFNIKKDPLKQIHEITVKAN